MANDANITSKKKTNHIAWSILVHKPPVIASSPQTGHGILSSSSWSSSSSSTLQSHAACFTRNLSESINSNAFKVTSIPETSLPQSNVVPSAMVHSWLLHRSHYHHRGNHPWQVKLQWWIFCQHLCFFAEDDLEQVTYRHNARTGGVSVDLSIMNPIPEQIKDTTWKKQMQDAGLDWMVATLVLISERSTHVRVMSTTVGGLSFLRRPSVY